MLHDVADVWQPRFMARERVPSSDGGGMLSRYRIFYAHLKRLATRAKTRNKN